MLFQNDDYGKDLLNGLKKGIQRSKVKVVAAEPYEVTAVRRPGAGREAEGVGREHVRDLRDAEVRDPGVRLRRAARLEAEADARNAVSSASNIMQLASEGGQNKVVNGSVSIVFLKDPTDPKWANDAAMKLYRQIMEQYAPGANVERRVPRLRHGGRVDGRRGAEEGRART